MNQYSLLAKNAVEIYIKEARIISAPENLIKEFFTKKAGVFVTIEEKDELRGCIGTYLPTKNNIAKEVIHNAIAAATEDYRFSPIQKEELSELSYTVYVLNKPEPIKSINELDPKKYGILVKSQSFSSGSDVIFEPAPRAHYKSGLLLPGLDGVDTSEKQISIACQKGNINPETEKIIIYKFTVDKFEQ
ncbi:AmmeMemoRadiSam system protein A [Candidatus Parcubacteria bacterium]|nr:AmmeMemoRadiSam system protein A [Candidatus Parcubacteria bacterium]